MRTSVKLKNIHNILNELTNHLMINANMVFFSGLLYGKMGISLYFFHYSRYNGNSLYYEYARYLLDLVKAQIHEDYPLDYERGLAGIGVGFNYLQKHGFYNVGDIFMRNIDSKIIKALNYERRVDLLTGFGRYLITRYESNPNMKDTLILLINLLIDHSKSDLIVESENTLSLLCDLYLLGIEKERIESYLLCLLNELIKGVKKEPILTKLFIRIKFSQLPFNILCKQTSCDVLKIMLSQSQTQLTSIEELQWLMQCRKLFIECGFRYLLPNVKRRIINIIDSFHISKLDELFNKHNDFAFRGGFAGLGIALISMQDKNVSWINLL